MQTKNYIFSPRKIVKSIRSVCGWKIRQTADAKKSPISLGKKSANLQSMDFEFIFALGLVWIGPGNVVI